MQPLPAFDFEAMANATTYNSSQQPVVDKYMRRLEEDTGQTTKAYGWRFIPAQGADIDQLV